MKVRSITNKLSLSPRQRKAIEFAFLSARAITNFALDVALNEIHFIPGNLPSKYSFYKDWICSKKNKPQFEVLKDRKLVLSPSEKYYLPKGAAQSIIFDTYASLNSFKESFWSWKKFLRTQKKSKWRSKPRPPQKSVRPCGFTLAAGGRGVGVKADTLTLPAALGKPILPFPQELRNKLGVIKIQRVRLFPRWGEIFVTIVYRINDHQIKQLPSDRCIAIDPGVDSLAVINNIGHPPMLYKTGSLRYRNLQFRKEIGRLMTIYTSQGIQSGPTLDRILRKRYGFFKTELGRLANRIIAYCVRHSIGKIIVGDNKDWKRGTKLYTGKVTATFQLFPFREFQSILIGKAELEGIEVVSQEESYTSKASFEDGDFPSKDFRSRNGGFSGHIDKENYRVYVTAKQFDVHRDINAAANILMKYSPSLAQREKVRIFNPITVKW